MQSIQAGARERANATRFLAIDPVNKAKSGHPGAPMDMADIAEVFVASSPATQVYDTLGITSAQILAAV
jgi:hypothetical protein